MDTYAGRTDAIGLYRDPIIRDLGGRGLSLLYLGCARCRWGSALVFPPKTQVFIYYVDLLRLNLGVTIVWVSLLRCYIVLSFFELSESDSFCLGTYTNDLQYGHR